MAPGLTIANSKGVPGTLGCLVKSEDDEMWGILSNYHVLLGKKAEYGETIWLIDHWENGTYQCKEIGQTKKAKIGIMSMHGEQYFVDCAVGNLHATVKQRHHFPHTNWFAEGSAFPSIGERIKKIGAVTGLTYGVVTDIRYPDQAFVDGKSYNAPNQILISPQEPYPAFSREGDSGSVLLNDQNRVVGLLWGCNANGEGVACHIAPVLKALKVNIERPPFLFFQKMTQSIIDWWRRP